MRASDRRERLRKRAVASSISSGDTGININHEIYAARIRALYQHTPMVLAVNVANSALVAVVLGAYLEQARWWIFFGLVITLTGLRAIGWICYRHYQHPDETTTKWPIFATAGSSLSGLLLGL